MFGEHRVPEPVDDVGELGGDGRVDVGVVGVLVEDHGVDRRRDGPGELLEHHVLVLHLVREPGRLEEPLLIAPVVRLRPGEHVHGPLVRPRVVEALEGLLQLRVGGEGLLDGRDLTVVLVVEDGVHRGEGDEVGSESDVVIAAQDRLPRLRVEDRVSVVVEARLQLTVHDNRGRAVRDVLEEGVSRGDRVISVDR